MSGIDRAKLPPVDGFRESLDVVASEWLDVERFQASNKMMEEMNFERGDPSAAELWISSLRDQEYNTLRIELHTRIGNACKMVLNSTSSDEMTRNAVLDILETYKERPTFWQRIKGKKRIPADINSAPDDFLMAVNIILKDLSEFF